MKTNKPKREGIRAFAVLETRIEIVVTILRERFDKYGNCSLQIRKPGTAMTEWVPAGDVVEITRRPRSNPIRPLTRAERSEYERLLKRWTSNERGADNLTPDEIPRFSHLSDRATAEGQ